MNSSSAKTRQNLRSDIDSCKSIIIISKSYNNLIKLSYNVILYTYEIHDILKLLRSHRLFIKTARSLREERPTLIQQRFDEAIRAKRRK